MSSTSETPIQYRGFVIAKSPRVEYGNFVFYKEPFDGHFQDADSVDHAKQQIDERIAEQESKNPNPYKDQIIKLELRKQALDIAINLLLANDFQESPVTLAEMRDEIKQQINDLQVDANTLPFPEK